MSVVTVTRVRILLGQLADSRIAVLEKLPCAVETYSDTDWPTGRHQKTFQFLLFIPSPARLHCSFISLLDCPRGARVGCNLPTRSTRARYANLEKVVT
jgi:hypothetical protein